MVKGEQREMKTIKWTCPTCKKQETGAIPYINWMKQAHEEKHNRKITEFIK